MRQQSPTITLVLLALSILSCAPGAVHVPSLPTPQPEDYVGPTAVAVRRLILLPGSYRYRLRQTAEITAQDTGNATPPSIVTTSAFFDIDISQQGDSSYSATISVDSLRIVTEGSIPPATPRQVERIDSIFKAVLSPTLVTVERQLPDSLCTYGQLTGIAHLILLPELALELEVPSRKTYSDTTRELLCRVGTRIDGLTTRQLQNLPGEPTEFAIEQQTDLHGTGLLRQDSVRIHGSVLTRGTASFTTKSRLPSSLLTNSHGTITIQLGTTITVFRQVSNQEIRLETP